ncbi:MAG: FtsX-like permease family protein [Gammaproteobacteria bacterium]|nr:FtsX-like permease family protein [Gammaproteobacteria bacterium]
MRRQSWLRETGTLLGLGLRNMLLRPLLPAIVVMGFLAVVLVMVGVLSVGHGLNQTYANSGEVDVAMAISDGALVESQSGLSESGVRALASEPGVAQRGAGPLVSPELVDTVELPKQRSDVVSDVVLRGVTPDAYLLHPRVHLVAGRMYRSGVREVIVGRQASREYRGLRVGATLRSGDLQWTVTGIFAADGDIHESEIWTDLPGLQDALRQPDSYSSVYLKMKSPASYPLFAEAVGKDPRLAVQVQTEKAFYTNIASGVTGAFRGVASAIALLMALGAVVGAINLMYVSLAARLSDIATLRAVGFRRFPVLCALLCEGLVLGLTGGVIGGSIAYAAFDGYQAGTIFGAGRTQVDFQFSVTAGLISGGILFALAMGFIGGLFPAIRAARLAVAKALRDA